MYDNEILFPERAKYKDKGPKDCKFGDTPITAIIIQRPTGMDGESTQITVPIYATDSREDMLLRFNVLAAVADIRMVENNQALLKAEELAVQQNREKEIAAKAHSATLVAIKKAGKAGDLKAVEAIAAGGPIDQTSDHSGSAQPS